MACLTLESLCPIDTTAAPDDASRILCPSCVSSQSPWLLTIRGGGLLILAWRVETHAREITAGALLLRNALLVNVLTGSFILDVMKCLMKEGGL